MLGSDACRRDVGHSNEQALLMRFFDDYFDEINARISDVDRDALDQLTSLFQKTRDHGRKVILAGNGGSAAMHSHVPSI